MSLELKETPSGSAMLVDPGQLVFKSSSLALLRARRQKSRQGHDGEGGSDMGKEVELLAAQRVLDFMYSMWRKGKMCDVTLTTCDGKLLAHKIALGAYSEELTRQFVPLPMGEAITISLQEFSSATLKPILVFLYTTHIHITYKNVEGIARCARELGIDIVVSMCKEFLKQYTVETCLQIYIIVEAIGFDDLQEEILNFILEHFVAVSRTEAFLAIPQARLLHLLTLDALKVASELDVFRAVVRWVNKDREGRLPLVLPLLRCVRFQLISPEDLVTHVEVEGHIFQEAQAFSLLYDAMKYHALLYSDSKLAVKYPRQEARQFQTGSQKLTSKSKSAGKGKKWNLGALSGMKKGKVPKLAEVVQEAVGKSKKQRGQLAAAAARSADRGRHTSGESQASSSYISDDSASTASSEDASSDAGEDQAVSDVPTTTRTTTTAVSEVSSSSKSTAATRASEASSSTTESASQATSAGSSPRSPGGPGAPQTRSVQVGQEGNPSPPQGEHCCSCVVNYQANQCHYQCTHSPPQTPGQHPQAPGDEGYHSPPQPNYVSQVRFNMQAAPEGSPQQQLPCGGACPLGQQCPAAQQMQLHYPQQAQQVLAAPPAQRYIGHNGAVQRQTFPCAAKANSSNNSFNPEAVRMPQRSVYPVVVGGMDISSLDAVIPGQCVTVLDASTNTWKSLTELPHNTHHHGLAVVKGKMYVIGGALYDPTYPDTLGKATAAVWCYDPDTHSWTRRADMKDARVYAAVAVHGDMHIYAIGGEDQNKLKLDSIERYDIHLDRWVYVARMASGKKIGASAAVHADHLYIAGGYNRDNHVNRILPDVECFNLLQNRWVQKNLLPTPVCHAGLVEVQGALYLVGGRTRHWDSNIALQSLASVLRYNDQADSWEQVAELETPRHDAGCVAIGGLLFVAGGMCTPSPDCLSSVECLDTLSGGWLADIQDMPWPAVGLACSTLAF